MKRKVILGLTAMMTAGMLLTGCGLAGTYVNNEDGEKEKIIIDKDNNARLSAEGISIDLDMTKKDGYYIVETISGQGYMKKEGSNLVLYETKKDMENKKDGTIYKKQ